MVIRTGFGIYFSPNQMDDFSDGHESTGQRFDVSSADIPGLSWPVSLALLPAPSYSPKAWDPNRRDGYDENWDFAVQRLFPHSFLGQIAYHGSEGHHLFSAIRTNLIDPLTGTRPLPQFGEFNEKGKWQQQLPLASGISEALSHQSMAVEDTVHVVACFVRYRVWSGPVSPH
jgi:hypothetical protein